MALLPGGIMHTVPEYEGWVMTNMERLVTSGQDLDFKVMRMAAKAILRGQTVSVIPLDDEVTMAAHINEFFQASQACFETEVKTRNLFTGVHVLICSYQLPCTTQNERPATPSANLPRETPPASQNAATGNSTPQPDTTPNSPS